MARKTKGYWEKRSTELMLRLEKGTEKTIDNLIEVYNQATKNINKEINEIYRNYASGSGLSKEVLTSMLNKRETNTYYRNLLKTIENIKDEDVRKKLLTKYNAPAYAYRINRFQALQDNIDVEIAKVADIEQTITKQRYIDTIQEGYYHNIYDIQKGLGYGFNFSQVDMKTINLMLNEKWISNGNFSTRIWNNADRLSKYLKINFTADTMSGKSISAMSRELSDTMNVGLYKATRLIRTEVNHFANESEMLSYQELGIEKYRFIATLDNVTCKHCASLDNKVFNVKDRQAGKNYPPIHANDRCTTVAVFEDDIVEDLKRSAIDENGNYIKVPQNINYDEWKETYISKVWTKQQNNDKIKIKDIQTIKNLKSINIEYNIVQKTNKKLTNDEIIEKISGGDETRGSCSSVALTYIGNKNGLDVLDFRGGESQNFFSTPQNVLKMCDDLKIKYEMELNYNDSLGAMNLLSKVEEGKEYYLSTGAHAAIIRKIDGKLQYLELQDKLDNGFKQFTTQTLRKRFGCKQTHTVQGHKAKARSLLIDIDEFTNKDEFKEILGYINTPVSKQQKGVNGNAK